MQSSASIPHTSAPLPAVRRDPRAPSRPAPPPLGRLLTLIGALSSDNLKLALDRQTQEGGRLGTCLLDLGLIEESTLLAALGTQRSASTVTRETLAALPGECGALLPLRAALFASAVPLRQSPDGLEVAMVDPSSLALLDALAAVSRRRILPGLALEIRVSESLERLYGLEPAGRFARTRAHLERCQRLAATS